MLLGGNNLQPEQTQTQELFIELLMDQQRYAEAYHLLRREPQDRPATWYNMALCYVWAGNHQQALMALDKASVLLPPGSGTPPMQLDGYYQAIRDKQNERYDYQRAVTAQYVKSFGWLFADNIVRLQVDCWLQLAEYAKVVETATRMAHKNYKNIADSLYTANKHLNQ